MSHKCSNHPTKKALSFCHNCSNYYCSDCLNEGNEYYYCFQTACYNKYLEEKKALNESYDSNPRFCPICIAETLPESTGNLDTINFVGTTISKLGGHCKTCNSFVAVKNYVIFGIPIKCYGYFRVINLTSYNLVFSRENKFLARKLKDQKLNLSELNDSLSK